MQIRKQYIIHGDYTVEVILLLGASHRCGVHERGHKSPSKWENKQTLNNHADIGR